MGEYIHVQCTGDGGMGGKGVVDSVVSLLGQHEVTAWNWVTYCDGYILERGDIR